MVVEVAVMICCSTSSMITMKIRTHLKSSEEIQKPYQGQLDSKQ